jgi:hypothetical protein
MGFNSDAGMVLFLAVVAVMLGIVWLNRWSQRSFRGFATHEAGSGISQADQAWMAQEARFIFTDPRASFMNRRNPSEFDRQMLILFDLMETGGGPQIDAQIEVVRQLIKHKPFFERWGTSNTLAMFWGNVQGPLTLRARKLKTNAAWQMVYNWNRLNRAVGSTFGLPDRVSPRWIGPPPLESLGVEEVQPENA